VPIQLGELFHYRELLWFLTVRDIKIRYKQTALGAAWAVIQPLFTMLLFSLFFGRLAKMPSDGVPYPIFSFAALVPWTFFANGLTQSSNSLVGSANLITKVYFPRLVVPIAAVLAGLVDLLIALGMMFCMMSYYGVSPSWNLIWLIPFVLLALITALGTGLWLSALNVEFRDVRHAVPFLAQFWMFATPIAYPSSLLSEPWRTIYAINPMVGVVDGFRWAMAGAGSGPGLMLLVSFVGAMIILISGVYYFRRMERTFADIV
jgi:lipopolysaccharide transport system permease protein